MASRVFLGWDRPLLERAVGWLLARRDDLPGAWLVVPTAESGRRLREALAVAAGGLLSPRVVTPGMLMGAAGGEARVAADWMEQVAWVEVLEEIGDWSRYEALFPEPPGDGVEWAVELAAEMVRLRRNLQDNGLTLALAARRLGGSVEADRWQALALLEESVERRLGSWGLVSRSRTMAAGLDTTGWPRRMILVGVTELPPLAAAALTDRGEAVTALIAAPETEAALFSELGQPLEGWNERPLPWPDASWGSVQVVADARQQAAEAVSLLAAAGTASDAVALGTADDEVGAELVRALGRRGWPAFHPAAVVVGGGWRGFLECWGRWLEDPSFAVMGDLMAFPQVVAITGEGRERLALNLATVRGRWMVQHPEDLDRRLHGSGFRHDQERQLAGEVMAATRALEAWRERFAREGLAAAMVGLLDRAAAVGDTDRDYAASLRDWLAAAAPLMARVRRRAGFWLGLMLADVVGPAPVPPPERVIDVQGWLELLYEPGAHLILCGMNDGRVPSRAGGDPWLGESARTMLGLPAEARRAARDAFLYQAMVEARRDGGRVEVICGKAGGGGDLLLPSRLLLAGPREDLPRRVAVLFRELEPPEAGMRWQADWPWQPRQVDPPARISVTALRDYLACPFRFYLKHLLGMADPETGRVEWNARDFGTVAHAVLERWGEDPDAREFSKTEALAEWLAAELDRVVAAWFGQRVPLAVRIQTESLRQRLTWFARVQACERAAGWQVVDVERKVELAFGDTVVVAKIDRIDRHRETGDYRVIDYKTGKVDRGVAAEHRVKLTANSVMPPHLAADSAAVLEIREKEKPVRFRWTNLQLPLYALAMSRRGIPHALPCYLTLGLTEDRVRLVPWEGFADADMDSAAACAELLVSMIRGRIFGPPAERVAYDDFRDLAAGRTLAAAVAPPFGAFGG